MLPSRRLVHLLLGRQHGRQGRKARYTYPTLEHDDHDPGPLAERIRRDKREFSIFGAERIRRDKREFSGRSSDDSSSDRDSCGTGSTSEANDIFDTLEDHLGYGSDSGSGW